MPNTFRTHLNMPSIYISEDFRKRIPYIQAQPISRPIRVRNVHGHHLLSQLSLISDKLERLHLPKSVILKFTGKEGFFLDFDKFTRAREDVELLSVNQFSANTQNVYYANVLFKSAKAFNQYKQFLESYSNETLSNNTKIELLDEIEDIDISYFDALFTDDRRFYPENKDERYWLEIWLNKKEVGVKEKFRAHLIKYGVICSSDFLELKDRLVALIYASRNEIDDFILGAPYIAEIRRAKYIKHFLDFSRDEQYDFVDDIEERIEEQIGDKTVIIMDTGVNTANEMIRKYVIDRLTIDSSIGTCDDENHGTGMASLILYGDLQKIFETSQPIIIHSNVLSLKIYDNGTPHEAKVINTIKELTSDYNNELYTMAITTESDGSGKPSAFSSAIDNFIANYKKLFFISAGNLDKLNGLNISAFNDLRLNNGIEDPAQSWNAITVGAYTEKCDISQCLPGNIPLANEGDLSPYSKVSTFEDKWPIKPEVVFEGGNVELNCNTKQINDTCNLSLIACDARFSPTEPFPPFCSFNATSAATALASKFATELMSKYPDYWPETIRALMIHSAQWTEIMKRKVGPAPNKSNLKKWLRFFGYGVPNMTKAKWSTQSALSLILEQYYSPYRKETDGTNKEQVIFITLPWPKEFLLKVIADKKIKVTVTLSHFVYTNASSRGYSSNKYSYQPYFLQFRMKPADISDIDFIRAVNKLRLDEQKSSMNSEEFNEYKEGLKNDCDWIYGINQRRSGSIIKDVFQTTGADLASMDKIAIYPETGWMKEDKTLSEDDFNTRFSLVMSLEVEDDIDIYTPIENEIQNIIAAQTLITT